MKRSTLIMIMIIFSSVSALKAQGVPKQPKAGKIPSVTFPAYQEAKLSNGIKVFVVQDKRAPLVTFTVRINSGKTDFPENTALPGLLGELLDKGTLKQSAEEFNYAIDSIGADFSASVGDEYTTVRIEGLNVNTPTLVQLLAEAIRIPAFANTELDKEKKKALAGLESLKENPDYLSSIMQRKAIFGESNPFAQEAKKERIESVTTDKLAAFHHSILSASNMSIAVVGDISKEVAINLLEGTFGSLPKNEVKRSISPTTPMFEKPTVFIVDRPTSVQSNIAVISSFPKYAFDKQPDLDLAVSILGGGFSGRLFQNLREKHGWTYGSYTSSARFLRHGVVSHLAEVRNDVTDSAVAEIIKEVKTIGKESVSDVELERTKQYLSGRYLLSLENSQVTANRLLDINFYGISKDYYATLVKRYLGATKKGILAIAKENIAKENYAIVVVGNASEIKTKLEPFGKVIVFGVDFVKK